MILTTQSTDYVKKASDLLQNGGVMYWRGNFKHVCVYIVFN